MRFGTRGRVVFIALAVTAVACGTLTPSSGSSPDDDGGDPSRPDGATADGPLANDATDGGDDPPLFRADFERVDPSAACGSEWTVENAIPNRVPTDGGGGACQLCSITQAGAFYGMRASGLFPRSGQKYRATASARATGASVNVFMQLEHSIDDGGLTSADSNQVKQIGPGGWTGYEVEATPTSPTPVLRFYVGAQALSQGECFLVDDVLVESTP